LFAKGHQSGAQSQKLPMTAMEMTVPRRNFTRALPFGDEPAQTGRKNPKG